jgi:hypothetical protein
MKLNELVKTSNWINIETELRVLFPEIGGKTQTYRRAFEKLQTLEELESDLYIELKKAVDDEKAESQFVDVFGKRTDEPESSVGYALEFVPWQEWLGMDISKTTISDFSKAEIVCHCLYEMTFFGTSEKEINERAVRLANIQAKFKG